MPMGERIREEIVRWKKRARNQSRSSVQGVERGYLVTY